MATAREAAILGIDLGTTEVKAGLVTLDGRLLGLARAATGPTTDAASGRAEQDPDAWWGALATAVRRLVSPGLAEVLAIAVDGHGPTLVAVDAAGRADPAGDHLAGLSRGRGTAELVRRDGPARLVARRAAGGALGRAPRAGGRRARRAGTSRRGTRSRCG